MRTINNATGTILGVLLLLVQQVTAQQITTEVDATIRPQLIEIAYNKTTNLIFPFGIKSVDRGSSEVLVKKVEGVDNILLVKAGIENFEPTNLSVVTAEGALYSFVLRFNDHPSRLNFRVSRSNDTKKSTAIFTNSNDWKSRMQSESRRVSTKKQSVKGIRDRNSGMELQLIGLYTTGNRFYLQFEIKNNSNISYDVGQLRLYIKDEKVSKRTASQEIEFEPLHTFGNAQSVNAQSRQIIVMTVEKFTIPDKKQMIIQLLEKNGGRNLLLKIKNKQLSKVKPI